MELELAQLALKIYLKKNENIERRKNLDGRSSAWGSPSASHKPNATLEKEENR